MLKREILVLLMENNGFSIQIIVKICIYQLFLVILQRFWGEIQDRER